MNGQTVGWDENIPYETESLGLADDRIRSIKTSVRVGLDDEHNWPSAGGANTGYHRLGAGRTFVGAQSTVSSSGTDGRLMQTSDTSRLFGVGSGGTVLFGAATMLSAASFPGGSAPQRHYWAVEFGADETDPTSGRTNVTYPNSGFSGLPFVYLTHSAVTQGVLNISTHTSTATGFFAFVKAPAGSSYNLNAPFQWISIGTRVL